MRHPWAVYSAGSKQMLRKAGCTYSTTKSCSLIAKLVKPSETIVKSNDSTKKKKKPKAPPLISGAERVEQVVLEELWSGDSIATR